MKKGGYILKEVAQCALCKISPNYFVMLKFFVKRLILNSLCIVVKKSNRKKIINVMVGRRKTRPRDLVMPSCSLQILNHDLGDHGGESWTGLGYAGPIWMIF